MSAPNDSIPSERAHPTWPARPGVEVGCDDRDCAACYEQWYDSPLRPEEYDVPVMFRVSGNSPEAARAKVEKIIKNDRFESTSVGMYVRRDARISSSEGSNDGQP